MKWTFEQYVVDVFSEHHSCMGFDQEEIENVLEDSTHETRVKWLKKEGYDLRRDYHNSIK